MTLAVDRQTGQAGEVAFCRYALAHGYKIRAAHPTVLNEVGVVDAKRLPDNSTLGDVSLDGIVPLVYEVKAKPSGPWLGEYWGWEVERLRKMLDATRPVNCIAYYTVLYDGRWTTALVEQLDALVREDMARVEIEGRAAMTWFGAGAGDEKQLADGGIAYFPLRFFRPLEATWCKGMGS